MTVYVYGASQSSQVMQLTTVYDYWISIEKAALIDYYSNTNHALLYNNQRIDKNYHLLGRFLTFNRCWKCPLLILTIVTKTIVLVDILKFGHKYKCNSVNTNSCVNLKYPL